MSLKDGSEGPCGRLKLSLRGAAPAYCRAPRIGVEVPPARAQSAPTLTGQPRRGRWKELWFLGGDKFGLGARKGARGYIKRDAVAGKERRVAHNPLRARDLGFYRGDLGRERFQRMLVLLEPSADTTRCRGRFQMKGSRRLARRYASGIRETDAVKYFSAGLLRIIRLDTSKLDHFGPLLGLIGDELAEVGRRAGNHCEAQVGNPRLELGIGEGCVDSPC
jgi:hypothetical protein